MELKQLEILEKLISGIIKGYSYSLVVVSPAGHGKTETTLNTLSCFGLKDGEHFLYLNTYISPLSFFKQLKYVNQLKKPKILVLDDCEDIFTNVRMVSLLKGALWQLPNGLRKVSWISTSSKVKEESFYFEGRIILLLNRFNRNNPIINAVADRGYYFEFKLSNAEILALIKNRLGKSAMGLSFKEKLRVFKFLAKHCKNSKRLSLRTWSQALSLYRISPNHWQNLILKLL